MLVCSASAGSSAVTPGLPDLSAGLVQTVYRPALTDGAGEPNGSCSLPAVSRRALHACCCLRQSLSLHETPVCRQRNCQGWHRHVLTEYLQEARQSLVMSEECQP